MSLRLRSIIAGVLIACGSVSAAQPIEEKPLPAHVQGIVDAARGAAAEFRSDALIRLASSALVPHRSTKKRLLEEAFAIAVNAQEPVKRESAIASVDTRAATSSRGFDLDLDRLSLQARAAEAMLGVDPLAARELFAQLHPSVQPLTCEDALIYQFTDFYTRAGTIFSKAFSPEARAEQEHTRFLEGYVAEVVSPAQVAGAAELLRRSGLPAPELGRLTMTFAWSLERIGGDSRSFFQAPGAPASVIRLVEHVRSRGVAADRLIEALRTYLVRNLATERCATSDVNQRYWLRIVEDFNDSIRFMGSSEIPRITDAEIAPAHPPRGEPISHPYWQTPETKALLEAEQQLVTRRASAGGRSTDGESLLLLDYLDALNRWNGDSENTEHDYFHQKAALYVRLLRFVSAASERQRVLTDATHFLSSYDMERDSRMAWAVRLEDVIRVVNGWPGDERAAAFALLDRFGTSAIKLRVTLEIGMSEA